MSRVAEAEAKVSSNTRLFAGLGMAEGHRRCCAVKRCQERRTAGPGELMALITPDADALFVWRQFTESGRTARGDILLRLPEGTGELAGARDDPARRTLRMAQVARGEAVHGIVFTSVHCAGVASPVGAGGAVAEFGANSATFGEAPYESTLLAVAHR